MRQVAVSHEIAKPLLFVDVDGVVLVFGSEEAMLAVGAELVQVGRIQQWTAADITSKLQTLEEHFECVWATAWFGRAVDELAPVIGVGTDWPVLRWGDMKLPAITVMAGSRPWAFVDDDINFELREFEGQLSNNSLLVSVDSDLGLTDVHVDELLKFAQSLL